MNKLVTLLITGLIGAGVWWVADRTHVAVGFAFLGGLLLTFIWLIAKSPKWGPPDDPKQRFILNAALGGNLGFALTNWLAGFE